MASDPAAPTASQNIRDLVEATRSLPDVMRLITSQITPAELAKFGAASVVSPGYGNLQTQLYDTSGRELNRIGSSIAGENARGEIGNNINSILGGGLDLAALSNIANSVIDPEFFRTRSNMSDALNTRINGGLTGSEQTEIERGLNRQNVAQGTLDVPSATTTVSNALTYGKAGRDALDVALGQANNFLQSSRVGTNGFQVATGKTTGGNTGDTKFLGVAPTGNDAQNLGSNLLGQSSQLQGISNQINSQRQSGFANVMGSLPDY